MILAHLPNKLKKMTLKSLRKTLCKLAMVEVTINDLAQNDIPSLER